MLRIKIIICALLFFNAVSITSALSNEDSKTGGETNPILDEIRWLQAESFLMEVTSVSKKPQKLSDSAAAIFVITQEGIRRSGATHIPDLLRMVPGLQVAQADANKWAISSRGFNRLFANKLLVLMDGRSVYTPLFPEYTGMCRIIFWQMWNVLRLSVDRAVPSGVPMQLTV